MDFNWKIDLILANGDNKELLSTLKYMHVINIDPESSQPVPLNVSDADVKTLEKILVHVKTDPILLKETYRCLRNCVVFNPKVQDVIINTEILNLTHCLLEKLIEVVKEEENKNKTALKMLLLFLTNLCVNNANTGRSVWDKFESKFDVLLRNRIFVNNSSALVYNILCQNTCIQPRMGLLQAVFDLLEQNEESEFLCFLLEHFVRNNLLVGCYKELKVEHRMLILEELKEKIVRENEGGLMRKDLLEVLVGDFKMKSDCILKTVTDYLKEVEPLEVALLLEIVASCSSKEEFLKFLQNDRSLLINSVFLLRSMHSAGKEGLNCFTAIQKLSEMKLGEDVGIREHPGFGFKVGLIRVLGNLAWKNRPNQDEMRELECIPLLLDCCNMDARNPLIIQWVVFAIRNLCEKNLENQRVIASLTKRGVVESSTLHEMGITLHGDGDSQIKIAPLGLNK